MIADENLAKHNDANYDNNEFKWSQLPLNSYNINH